MKSGAQTFSHILSQPEAWSKLAGEWPYHAEKLAHAPPLAAFDRLIITGCGSAYFAAQALAAVASALLRVPAVAVTASDAALFPHIVFAGRGSAALIALSRSGQTSETLEAVRAFRHGSSGPVLALTAVPESELAQTADFLLDARGGDEPGIVQIRSLSTMLLLGLAAVAHLGGRPVQPALERLPSAAAAMLGAARPLALHLGSNPQITRFFFLGSGPWRGIASECMLKVKEMSHAQSESFHTLEFRHGLGADADAHSLIAGLLSDHAAGAEQAVLSDFRADRQVMTVAIGVHAAAAGERAFALPLPDDLPEWARLPLALPFAQLVALERARLNGLNPDEPQHLKAYIALEGPLT